MSQKVVLDTSILMLVHTHGVDVLSELERIGFAEAVAPECVLSELRGLARGKGKNGVAARVALALAERCTPHPSLRGVPTDDCLLGIAQELSAALATSDAELKKRARERKIVVVEMRGLDHLDVV
ncbi:MAG: type II toxin-antitoxin system VapC family toxin [Methermicoccaceae archaeon]